MASLLRRIHSAFWREDFWLPRNVTWSQFKNTDPDVYIPQYEDLYVSLILGVIFVGIRVVYDTWLVTPFATWLGLKHKRKRAEANVILERFFNKHGTKYDQKSLAAVIKQTDWEERRIQRWLRVRSLQNRDTPLAKFSDVAWHFLIYSVASIYGLAVLWNKSWFAKTKECWTDWPRQHVPSDIYWYYQGELGLYWCLVFRVMTDHRRKDFAENVVHHITTMTLMFFSYFMNFVRVGTLVLVVHDVVDPLLAMAKMAKYAKQENLCTCIFAFFTLVWLITRLFLYPYIVLYTITYDTNDDIHAAPLFVAYNFLLYLLLVLHVIWTYMIVRTIIRNFTQGGVSDVRSDSDDKSSCSN